jgi:hypothetical protein
MLKRVVCLFAIAVSTLLNRPGLAEEPKRIEDNSFLLEEAYNQEDGVVQHIQALQYSKKSKDWLYSFTQEWPVPKQMHQFSYVIPAMHLNEADDTGIGDIMLNYRYQAIIQDAIAFAPRISLILPTGDYKRGLGAGAVGYQVNMPLSVSLFDNIVTHWNIGATFTHLAKDTSGERSNVRGLNYGFSVIYLMTENVNLMLETVGTSTATNPADGDAEIDSTLFINPGMRFAVNFESGLQVVPGFSVPIGIGPSEGEYGGLLYLSFEHPLF